MMQKYIVAFAAFMILVMAPTMAGEWVAGGLAYGDVNDQFGEANLEDACNDLGVEWSYVGVDEIDGEPVNPGLTDIPRLTDREGPIAQDNVTIVCHLNQGFLASTQETVVVNASER